MGGLSNDPVKRKRQLDALRAGNDLARVKYDELETGPSPAGSPAGSPAEPSPAESTSSPAGSPAADDVQPGSQPGNGRVKVGRVDYSKPGKRGGASPAKPKRASRAASRAQPGREPAAVGAASPAEKPRLPGFLDGLQLPFGRFDG